MKFSLIVFLVFTTLLSAQKKPSKKQMIAGKKVYDKTCIACHQANGKGDGKVFPPLAKSDYLLKDKKRAIRQVLLGSSGPIKVNGKTYNGVMPPQPLNDKEVADVLTYVLNSWGNKGGKVSKKKVKKIRKKLKKKKK